jgi:hypothetical protein
MTDPTEIRNLPIDSPLVILNPDGEIRVWSTTSEAAELAEDGAIVLFATTESLPGVLARYSIKAANRQHQMGNKDIHVSFGTGVWNGLPVGIYLDIEDLFIVETDENGRYYSPVIRKPDNYILYTGTGDNRKSMPPVEGEGYYWIDGIIKGQYSGILITPVDFVDNFFPK